MNKLFFYMEGWKTLVYIFVFYFVFQFLFFLFLKNFFPNIYYGYESSFFDVITNANKDIKELFLNESVIKFVQDISPQYTEYLKNVISYDIYSKENKYYVLVAGLIHLIQTFFYCWWIIFSFKNTEEKNFLNYFLRFISINLIFYVIIHLVFAFYSFNAAFSFKYQEEIQEYDNYNISVDIESNIKIFENEYLYFEYPKNWKTISLNNLIFKAENEENTGSLVIISLKVEDLDLNLESGYILELLNKINNIVSVENQGEISNNNRKGYYFDYISERRNVKYRVLNARYLIDDLLYVLEFISEERYYSDNIEYFYNIFETLKIK